MNRDEEIRIMSLPGMQEKFREAMGGIVLKDKVYDPEHGEGNVTRVTPDRDFIDVEYISENKSGYIYVYGLGEKPIRLPLPIDPVNPERGLLGMLNREKYRINIDNKNINVIDIDTFIWVAVTDIPTLALLKALAHQWGIEP